MGIRDWINKLLKEEKVIEGEKTKDKFYFSEKEFPDREDALREFPRSVAKLFNVNKWSDLPGITSTFTLYDSMGKEKVADRPEERDYLKINLPGPVPENWVIVTEIKEEDTFAEFTVSPSEDPTEKKEDQEEIEHFFIDEATSTFRVELEDKKIVAFEIGKNEGINNEEDAGKRKLINTLIAEGGWAGFQELQWKKLTDYLVHQLEIEEPEK